MSTSRWAFFRFVLIVTGKGEEQFLPRIFRSLESEGHSTFKVGRRVPQLRPISSARQRQRMVGTGSTITSRDEEIGLFARRCLQDGFDYVILVDDLEHEYKDQAFAVFQRYRTALDTMLHPVGLGSRASVHFLVNMLEAYYLADAQAVNNVLGTTILDYEGDVETIRHPKNDLKALSPGFDEIEHGRLIVSLLDVPRVLSNPATCRALRTLFGWCSRAICHPLTDVFQLRSGSYFEVTKAQIDALPDVPSV
jgi:hypothetical protein